MLSRILGFIRGKLSSEMSTKQLIERGLKVGERFSRQEGCIIDPSHCWLISIGDCVSLAPRVHIIAHDASTKMFLDYTKIGFVEIGNRVFIGAGSIILPNVKIGDDVIIGAGSVVAEDIPSGSLVVGNPAAVVGRTADYLENQRDKMKSRPVYPAHGWTVNSITESNKNKMIEELKSGIGYVE